MLRPRAILALSLALAGCEGVPCRSPGDCPFGSYCVLDVDGSRVSGSCTQDCLEASDCPAPASLASRAICTNEGRCRVVARIPQLRPRVPEPGQRFDEGTRFIQVSGEVETAADEVRLEIRAVGSGGCPGGPPVQARLANGSGDFQLLPFTVDRVPVEPSTRSIVVEARVGGASRQVQIPIEVACPGCAEVRIDAPSARTPVPGLVLGAGLIGQVEPAVPLALWRVRGPLGGLFDGRLPVDAATGRFQIERLPLFGGTNRIEVAVSGVGAGAGETRCSTFVRSSAVDRGLRVVMTWDAEGTDLDLHLVGPGGRFLDPMSSLSPRTPRPVFGGRVLDDFDGLGPELLFAEDLPEGAYGLVVEPVIGAATATLRLVRDGMPVTVGPVGPVFLDADRAELWVAGILSVTADGDVAWEPLGDRVPLAAPPVNPPSAWPAYR